MGDVSWRMIRATAGLAPLVVAVGGCSGSSPDPAAAPRAPTRSLGFALAPGPCVVGANVVSASAFASRRAEPLRYLGREDGELRVSLALEGEPPRPVTIRYLASPDAPAPELPGPPWNLELSFESPRGGQCPLRIEFTPSSGASAEGLQRAETTMVMKAPPPPPPPRRE